MDKETIKTTITIEIVKQLIKKYLAKVFIVIAIGGGTALSIGMTEEGELVIDVIEQAITAE